MFDVPKALLRRLISARERPAPVSAPTRPFLPKAPDDLDPGSSFIADTRHTGGGRTIGAGGPASMGPDSSAPRR